MRMISNLLMLSCLSAVLSAGLILGAKTTKEVSFDENYYVNWGNVDVRNEGQDVQLSMDRASGSGFQSKKTFASGMIKTKIKLHPKDSAGVVTGFYLQSQSDHRDELDFEFLGNKEGKLITLQTNLYVNGVGGREQKFNLWFDPSDDYHYYTILWNQQQIVFYVDRTPIRVLKNNKGSVFPSQAMKVFASLWNGEDWATEGGTVKTNWSHAPFHAYFQRFGIDGCSVQSSYIKGCHSQKLWWNRRKFWKLSSEEEENYEKVRKNHMTYDYCTDTKRYPFRLPECFA